MTLIVTKDNCILATVFLLVLAWALPYSSSPFRIEDELTSGVSRSQISVTATFERVS
jgi:hypothetical protein